MLLNKRYFHIQKYLKTSYILKKQQKTRLKMDEDLKRLEEDDEDEFMEEINNLELDD